MMNIQLSKQNMGRLGCFAVLLTLAGLLSACAGNATPAAATAAPQATSTTAAAVPATGRQPNATTTSANAPGQSGGPAGNGNARQAVINALQAFQKAGPYRVDSTITSNGKTQQMTSEVILPDRFHIKMKNEEMLVVGSKTYIKQGNQWAAFPIDLGSIIQSSTISVTQEVINGMRNFQIVGPDTVKGSPTMVFQYNASYGAGAQAITSTNKLWVDLASGLPVKQEIDGEVAGVKSTTVQLITYDPSITIEAPK